MMLPEEIQKGTLIQKKKKKRKQQRARVKCRQIFIYGNL